jgi:hypothetical protein
MIFLHKLNSTLEDSDQLLGNSVAAFDLYPQSIPFESQPSYLLAVVLHLWAGSWFCLSQK